VVVPPVNRHLRPAADSANVRHRARAQGRRKALGSTTAPQPVISRAKSGSRAARLLLARRGSVGDGDRAANGPLRSPIRTGCSCSGGKGLVDGAASRRSGAAAAAAHKRASSAARARPASRSPHTSTQDIIRRGHRPEAIPRAFAVIRASYSTRTPSWSTYTEPSQAVSRSRHARSALCEPPASSPSLARTIRSPAARTYLRTKVSRPKSGRNAPCAVRRLGSLEQAGCGKHQEHTR
jgi:hypothetical protein